MHNYDNSFDQKCKKSELDKPKQPKSHRKRSPGVAGYAAWWVIILVISIFVVSKHPFERVLVFSPAFAGIVLLGRILDNKLRFHAVVAICLLVYYCLTELI